MEIFSNLKGNRTYITALAVAFVVVLNQLGYIDNELANGALGLLGATGLAFLRAGVDSAKDR